MNAFLLILQQAGDILVLMKRETVTVNDSKVVLEYVKTLTSGGNAGNFLGGDITL
jgi:hypothetical protein